MPGKAAVYDPSAPGLIGELFHELPLTAVHKTTLATPSGSCAFTDTVTGAKGAGMMGSWRSASKVGPMFGVNAVFCVPGVPWRFGMSRRVTRGRRLKYKRVWTWREPLIHLARKEM